MAQNSFGAGDTGAVQVKHNKVSRELYHTDWVAQRTLAYLDSLSAEDDWFVWMSFPDPHHPWDPPESEIGRVNWRELDVPAGYPGSHEKIDEILSGKPRHWREWWTGERVTCYEAPPDWVPKSLTTDQLREIDALTHVKNELIDEAVGRVMANIAARGWDGDTDVIFSTDHGEFQGDYGLLFKGPHHVESLMRLPLIWRPAPNAKIAPQVLTRRWARWISRRPFARSRAWRLPNGWKALPCPKIWQTRTNAKLCSRNGIRNSTAHRFRCARFIAMAGSLRPTTNPRFTMAARASFTT